MDFSFSGETLELKRRVRQFVREVAEPYADEIEKQDEVPRQLLEQTMKMGLFGLGIPKSYGGLGLSMLDKCAVLEELGYTNNGYASIVGCHTGIGSVGIVELGSEAQKRAYLPDMAAGERLGAFALTEPDAGSHAYNLQTKAVRIKDKYILNGTKHFITNGAIADVFTVMAVTDPQQGVKGISSFIVDKRFPGFSVGQVHDKMGLRGSPVAQLVFEDLEVPAENLLGREGQGYVNALKILTNGRAGLAARNLGSCQKLLDLSAGYASRRVQFAKPIFEQQAVQHMLADMAMEIEALRWMTYRTAWMTDHKANVIKEAAMCKLYASEVFNRIADRALQIHGGMGYMKEFEIERFYRDARITRIYEGTSEIQRNIIAAQLRKEYEQEAIVP
ncbi:acyl-CoA dehydrogenase family protein [Paenibacillus koleovorans]|uniref:acyl-CoA dehydrogenase family protein n=1 Tax=Paenibacillus koleovorans TaxID=121608 RepID=UPI000FDAAF2F|nr:acyl-CoA dehydrogenase family protein [Paenibacillus koleovorans]